MKAIRLLLLCSGFHMAAMAGEPKSKMVVWAKDGTQMTYVLSEEPKAVFSGNNLVISTHDVELSYDLATIRCFEYEPDKTTTNLRVLGHGDNQFRFDGQALVFPHLDANCTVCIYQADGKPVFKHTCPAEGGYAFPLAHLGSGVYIVCVNDITYKITKK